MVLQELKKGHRERLKRRFMQSECNAMEDYEILELLLFYSVPYKDVKDTAKQLLHDYESLSNVLNLEEHILIGYKCISMNTVCLFKVVRDLNNKILKEQIIKKPVISSWASLITYLKSSMGSYKKECLCVLYLNKKNEIIKDDIESYGTVDEVPCYPREIIKKSIMHGATAIILAHNHPSGDVKPSKADIELTKNLNELTKMLGIKIYDHVIISKNNYYSFKNNSGILN